VVELVVRELLALQDKTSFLKFVAPAQAIVTANHGNDLQCHRPDYKNSLPWLWDKLALELLQPAPTTQISYPNYGNLGVKFRTNY
jgi:hypothetical protein